MMRILPAVLISTLILVASARDAEAFGWFGHSACDDHCCETGCCEGVCDSLLECDSCGVCGNTGDKCDCLGRMKLLGCLKPSDHCFDDFISPMINFAFFEDPRTLTEIRPIYVYHETPKRVGDLGLPGGAVHLFAMEIRVALTQRLSLIAVKDGYIIEEINDGPLDDLIDDGWAGVTAGLKYNILRDPHCGRIASVGFTYELPVGSRRTQQAVGDGEFHAFITGGQRIWNGKAHLLSSLGYRFPVDDNVQSSSFHWSSHFDYRLSKRVYYVSEMSWWHWTSSADTGLPVGVAGHDLFNISATNVTGNDLVTKNFGMKYKPNRHVEAGIAYEFPLTGRKDILDNRIQLDLIYRY